MDRRKIYRILDANFNRVREGLRVCEEVARFVLDDAPLTKELKILRHRIETIARRPSFPKKFLLAGRDSDSDVGRTASFLERQSKKLDDVFLANSQRVKESLRVLEEFSKIIDINASAVFKRLRFKVYSLEKKIVKRLATLSHS